MTADEKTGQRGGTPPLVLVKRGVQSLVLAAEISPANEIARYIVFGWAVVATGSIVVGGLAFGLATFLIEAIAVLVVVDVLEGPRSRQLIATVNAKLAKASLLKSNRSTLSAPIQVAIAMLLGSAVLVAAGAARDPERTCDDNRRHGLRAATLMALYFTFEGIVMGGAVLAFGWVPMIAGAVVIGTVVRSVVTGWARKRERMQRELDGREKYLRHRAETSEALGIGVFGEDLERALRNERTIWTPFDGNLCPALAPLECLHWFNESVIRRRVGGDRAIFCYLHPPVVDDAPRDALRTSLRSLLDEGAAIVSECYRDDAASPIAELVREAELSDALTLERFGSDEPSRVDFYIGHVTFGTSDRPVKRPSLHDVYIEAVERGVVAAADEGPALVESFSPTEIEQAWQMYRQPFLDLERDDPTLSGFTKDEFADLLRDSTVSKFVYRRASGRIVTLLILLWDPSQAPWFSDEYFKKHHAEFYGTGNILLFPGVVSDEAERGHWHASDLIVLATQLLALRGSEVLIAFECTQISTRYVPRIVEEAVTRSGVASVSGLQEPTGQIDYFAIFAASG